MKEPKFIALAFYVGNLYYKKLKIYRREDFRQVAYLAAIETEELEGRDVLRHISRVFRQACKELGFEQKELLVDFDWGHANPDMRWLADARRKPRRETGGYATGTKIRTDELCGVPGCREVSMYRDDHYGRLCKRHYAVLRSRLRRGNPDPYNGLEKIKNQQRATKPPCGVPGCETASSANDDRYGRLCQRHANMRNKRKRAGWLDPYKDFDEDQKVVNQMSDYHPETDTVFWEKIKERVSRDEWASLWLWATGETPILSDDLLVKARRVALEVLTEIERQMYG